jgi:hypothetical protein
MRGIEAMARDSAAGDVEDKPSVAFGSGSPAFIDFGCGRGESMAYAETLFRGAGIGIDIEPKRVTECQDAGFDVQQGDAITFDGRNLAPASLSIDLIPELNGLREFEAVCTNQLRAARDFTMIQHSCFDSAEILLSRGQVVAGHAAKPIRFRPRAIDYLHFVMQFGRRLDVVGLAVFGLGEPRTTPMNLRGLSGALIRRDQGDPAFRSIRVVIARKELSRFQWAMNRVGTGHPLLILESPQY